MWPDSTRNLPFLTRYLPVAGLFVPLSILALIGWVNWTAVWRDADEDMQRAAASIAEYGKQTFESFSAAAGRLNDRLRGMSDAEIRANEESLHKDLQRMDAESSRLALAYVIDRGGFPILSSSLYPVPRDSSLADRDFFQAMRGDDPPEVYVSKTFVGRFDGRLLFAVARKRQDTGNVVPQDGFDGVVVVSIDPEVLADGMRRLLPEATDRMALMRMDGHGISTTGGATSGGEQLPKVDPSSPFYGFAAANVQRAVYQSHTAIPGSAALLAMERIEGFPLYAVSLRPRAEIVAEWRETMVPYLAFALPSAVALYLLSRRVVRDQRQLAQRNATLTNVANLSADRLGRAKRFGLVGTFEFDLRTGVSRRSPEYMSVHGLPAVATDETHDDWERRLYPDDKARALEELKWALSDESGATDYGQSYRIVTPEGKVRWIAARGVIHRDENGRATMLLGAHTDVTPLRSSEMALAESDARLRLAHESVGIGTWEWVPSTRSLYCSNRMLEIFAFDPDKGPPRLADVMARVHPDDRRMLRESLRKISPTERFHCEFRVVRPTADGPADLVWVSARAALVALTPNAAPQVMGIIHDISDQKRSEDLIRLMANEVEHRAKNTLALISALLRMTKADSAAQLAQIMEGRIRALSSTMGLLRKSRWSGADLRDILIEAIEPFAPTTAGPQKTLVLTGSPVHIAVEAAQPLSMALNELATNASKYGALSVPKGILKISWHVEDGHLSILWEESGGPPVVGPPGHSGFGSKLVAILFEAQLGGVVTREWRPGGLVCTLRMPLRAEQAANVA